MNFKAWISAFRLRTLPLALSTVGMGSFLALENGFFQSTTFIWAAITTILLQILSNLANDYGDAINGADSQDRIGPERAVQSGAISAAQMKGGIITFVVLSFISGVILLSESVGLGSRYFYWFLGFGMLSILAAYTYTAGKRPYGYAGFGDIMVLLFFGLMGVGGSYFLFAQEISGEIFLPALALGALATGVLNINNMRDAESDRKAGKFTIPVRLGQSNAVVYHWFLILLAIGLSLFYIYLTGFRLQSLVWLLGLPMILLNGINVTKTKDPKLFDPFLKQLAIGTFLFMVFFGLALVL